MTAEAPAGLAQARCRSCGTVVQLAPPQPASAAAGAGEGQPRQAVIEPSRVGLAVAVGLLGPVLVGFAFGTAHHALDQPAPDTGTAGLWYLAALLLAGAAVFALWPAFGTGRVFPRATWMLLAAVPVFVMALVAGQAYDDDGLLWGILGWPLLGVYAIAIGISAAVLAGRQDGSSAAAVLVGGVGVCVGFGMAAAYLLLTLQEQAAEAREAHEAPAWGLLLTWGTLLALAARRRRA